MHLKKEDVIKIEVKDNNVDRALKILKRKLQREGFFKIMKLKSNYEKPSERKKRERTENIRRLAKDIEELTEFLTKGKSSERHKYRMELPRVDEEGITHYKHKQNEYEKFPLYKLFD